MEMADFKMLGVRVRAEGSKSLPQMGQILSDSSLIKYEEMLDKK